MTARRDKVVVAMSGGVDSSVAACLLVEQGYDVIGLFMRHGVKDASANQPEPQAAGGAGPTSPCAIPERQSPTIDAMSAPAENAVRELPAGAPPRSRQGCCSASDASDARYVAGMLGIPFYALNFEDEFDELIDYFVDEYARGRTPNPCVVCNDRLKFGRIVEYADAVGARYIATGHYARVERRVHQQDAGATTQIRQQNAGGTGCSDRNMLLRAIDERKDQSYVLFGLSREVLDRVMFPIGGLTKAQVRELASRYNLPNRDKPDSVEICFVPDRDYARVVRERRPEAFAEGDVLDTAGRVIGRHQGVAQYTVGQRRGLGIAAGRPIYVTELNVESNTVVMGEDEDLKSDVLFAERVNYLLEAGDRKLETGSLHGSTHNPEPQASACATDADFVASPFRAQVKIRYLHNPAPATVFPLSDQKVRVEFDEPQRAITPGQAVVFYDGDLVIGGGWIQCASRTLRTTPEAINRLDVATP